MDLLFMGLNDDPENLSQREKFVWVIDWFHTELENGGTDQVFYNFTGNYVLDAIEAFEAIGAPDSAATLRRACGLFPDGRPATEEECRRQQMDEIRKKDENAFNKLDGAWFEEDVYGLLLAYWKAHEPGAENVPEAKRRRNEVVRLFLDLPVVHEQDWIRLSDRQRYLWHICLFAVMAEGKGMVPTFSTSLDAEHIQTLMAGLEKIGATNTAAMMRKVSSFYRRGRPSADFRERMAESLPVFQKVKDAFGTVEIHDGVVNQGGREEDLFALLLEYWRDHE